MKRIAWIAAAWLLLSLSVLASAETYQVSPAGMSIGEALEKCQDGDVIELLDGIYAEPQESFPLTVQKTVTICAASGARPVIDAPAFKAALRVEASGVTLQGLDIHMRRTGIYAIGDDMQVERCRIILADEAWRTSSCAIWFGGIRRVKLQDCIFEGCSISLAGPPLSESSKNVPVLTGLFEVGEELEYFTSHTIENCYVNNKSLFYAKEQEQVTAPADAGQIICVGCGSVTVEDADVSDGSMGMVLVYNNQVTLRRCKADRCGVFGIYVAKCGGGILEECTAEGTNHGLDIRASQHIQLLRCEARGCDQGLFFSHVDDGVMSDCSVVDTGQGYFTAGGWRNLFIHCSAVNCENGFNLQKENDAAMIGCTVESCTVCGVRLDWTPTAFVHNRMSNNWVGVMAYGDVSFILADNQFENNASCGLYLRDIAYSRIGGNTFTGHEKCSVQAVGEMSFSAWQDNALDLPIQADASAVFDGEYAVLSN